MQLPFVVEIARQTSIDLPPRPRPTCDPSTTRARHPHNVPQYNRVVSPPSIRKTVPFTKLAASEHNHATPAAISHASPNRFIAECRLANDFINSGTFSTYGSTISECTNPGLTAFTRIPCCP